MALTKAKKNEKVKMLASELEGSTTAIVGTFKGLTAAKDFDLRRIVREAGGAYHVVKNKLAAKSSEGTKVEAALQGLKGVNSVAYTSGDPVVLAKALSTWVKDNAEFTFKLGIVDGRVINVSEIQALATLPGKDELFSKLLFLIQSPAQRLATVINATGRNLAVVVNMATEQGKFGAPEAAKAPEPVAEAPVVEAPAMEAVAETPAAEATTPEAVTPEAQIAAHPASEADPVAEVPAAKTEIPVAEAAHVEESGAGEQPSGAEQPENGTASQAGEAASTDPVEG
ncbi:MAG: 50S ribosomal protein L10 [Acidobacteriaceae bacterium]